jgi:hypothetical protein
MKKTLLILLGIILVVAILFAGLNYFSKKQKSQSTEVSSSVTTVNEQMASQSPQAIDSATAGGQIVSDPSVDGTLIIGTLKAPVTAGMFEIPGMSPGIYPVSFTNSSGNVLKLYPSTLQIFPGGGGKYIFSFNP